MQIEHVHIISAPWKLFSDSTSSFGARGSENIGEFVHKSLVCKPNPTKLENITERKPA